MGFLFLFLLLGGIILGLWKLFEKAGQKGWEALIPVYNCLVLVRIIGRPWWWVLLLFIPLLNLFVLLEIIVDLLRSFGKDRFQDYGLAILFPFAYLPYLGLTDQVSYQGKAIDIPRKSKTAFQEWRDALVFAVFAATLIRWAILEAFTIPTPSMEKTLLVGDFLFVSKIHYGPRTPKTPLQIPLTHQHIWGTEIPSYLDWLQLPQYRFPGLYSIKRNDIIVFNFPSEFQHPTDLKTHYIKRCVGIPGDVIKIGKQQLYVNGQQVADPPLAQYKYFLATREAIKPRIFDRFKIYDYQKIKEGYLVDATSEVASQLADLPFIDQMTKLEFPQGTPETSIFPDAVVFPWNKDNYGPLEIPFKGFEIKITSENIARYQSVIALFEDHKEVSVYNDQLLIDGEAVEKYVFKKNYFFMMGDNRHNSLDSRYWGFVPEDHIVGKALFIWLSVDSEASILNRIRWSRLFKIIE